MRAAEYDHVMRGGRLAVGEQAKAVPDAERVNGDQPRAAREDALDRAAGIVGLAAARGPGEGEAVIERLVGNRVFHVCGAPGAFD